MLSLVPSAFALPPIDVPVRTGAHAPGDSAVVIGIEDYFVLPDVPYAERDARAAYDFLTQTRGIRPERVLLLDRNANRERILGAVSEAAALSAGQGRVWIYFSGHGAASPDSGERVLLGADVQSELSTFRARSIAVSELRRAATATGAEALLILDTCYSGRDRSGASLQPGDRFAVPGWISDAPDRVAEWSAAGPDEWAGSLDEARHGAFTYLALGALRGWADGQLGDPPDGRISLEEAHRFVQDGLRTLGITDQHPVLLGDRGWVVSEATERPPRLTAPRPAPAPLPQVSALQPTQTQPTQTQPTQTQPVASGPQADEDWLNEGWSEPMDELMAFIDTSELNRLLERAQQLPLPSPDELGMLDALLEQDRGPASAGRTPRGSDPRLPPPGRRLDPVALQQLLLTLQEATYVHAKLELLQRLEIPLTSAQVGQLLDVLHHPSQRVQAVRILAPWVEDPSSVDAILAHCSWDDERRQIREVMEAYAQR